MYFSIARIGKGLSAAGKIALKEVLSGVHSAMYFSIAKIGKGLFPAGIQALKTPLGIWHSFFAWLGLRQHSI
jgi:hypothetical protein